MCGKVWQSSISRCVGLSSLQDDVDASDDVVGGRRTIEKPFFLHRVLLLILKFLPLENYCTLQQTVAKVYLAVLVGHIKI
jgi:hypothetical protein